MGELRAAFTGWEGGVCLRAESLQSDGLSAIPWTVDPQAPLSIGFSRREILEWVAMPSSGDLPNPGNEGEERANERHPRKWEAPQELGGRGFDNGAVQTDACSCGSEPLGGGLE